MSDLAIRTENLGKQYVIGGPQKTYDRLGDQLVDIAAAPFRRAGKILRGQAARGSGPDEMIWALEGVTFEVEHGETLGIVGRNGAGKSTLLKILSRITEPTSGYADLYGRVGSLLEVGTGFHPELTGRENIFLNGAILGMKKKEIERKLEAIVDFAEIGQFIDTAVKHYSSGMYVRLAFSVAAHLEPEILLVDEVLAVGDVAFQRKCLGKMDDVASEGRTVVFVSHNMGILQSICNRGIYLDGGKLVHDGPIVEVVETYLKSIEAMESIALVDRTDRKGHGKVRLAEFGAESLSGSNPTIYKCGDRMRFTIRVSNRISGLNVSFIIFDQIGQRVTDFVSKNRGLNDEVTASDPLEFVCEVDPFLILPGRYRVDVGVFGDNVLQDFIKGAAFIDVAEGMVNGRMETRRSNQSVSFPHRWTIPPG
jgi:lipopolysaccharide transport system ATP-binding protein